jgi:predicted O-linked N-acetylglucosamine transferase (SPINDLY family)
MAGSRERAGRVGIAPTEGADTKIRRLIEHGVSEHKKGNVAAAEADYREILAIQPEHPHALHLMGVLSHQRGDSETAIGLIEKAIRLAPLNADFFSNLGAAYYAKKRLDEAEASFRRGIELDPKNADSQSNLAAVLADRGQVREAIEHYKLACQARPDAPRYLSRLGELCLAHGHHAEAAEWLSRFLVFEPNDGAVHNNLAYCYERLGELKRAKVHYARAVELCPESPEINNNLGSVLGRLGEIEEAKKYFDKALSITPDKWENMANLAGTYLNRQDYTRALSIYEVLLEKRGDDARLWNDYACALSASGRNSDAIQAFNKSLELDPYNAETHNNIGTSLLRGNYRQAAIAAFKKAIDLRPRYLEPHINVCLALMYESRFDEASLYAKATVLLDDYIPMKFTNPHKVFRGTCDFDAVDELGDVWSELEQIDSVDISASFLEMLPLADTPDRISRLVSMHKKCGARLATRGDEAPLPPLRKRPRKGKLHLGFLSSDLRSHSAARFVKPIFDNYDRDRYEIFCYSPYEDANDRVQRKIKELVTKFTIVENRSVRKIASEIRDDEVDLLFDLNGYTKDSLIDVLAHRAAPVQVYWLGYPFTTGIPEVDYILLDPYYKPENLDWISEKPLVMPESWICFDSFEPEPISEKLPVERSGVITFGTFNNTYKFTREVVAAWAAVMRRVPNSRFFIVRPQIASPTVCTNITKEFARHGIGPERLYLIDNRRVGLSHFSFYDEIDISLDTFPLTGGTTTCDSIWMGVPCITLVGPSLHQRISYAILNHAGAGELCAHTIEEYVELAAALAHDVDSLREYRHGFRPALLASPLCQGERFTRNFEATIERAAAENGI